MNIIATKQAFLTADQKTLVDPEDPKAAFLFCVPGQRVDPKKLRGVTNAADYFEEALDNLKRESAEGIDQLTEVVSPSKRVAPEPAAPQGKAPKIVTPKTSSKDKGDE